MYQKDIKVITTRGSTDENPTVNWIYPDKQMEKFAELKNVDFGSTGCSEESVTCDIVLAAP